MSTVTDELIEDSNRRTTGFGHLRIENCVLTAESVSGYLGKELKNTELPADILAKLEDSKIYQVYRPGDALKKAIDSYNEIPLTDEHHFVDSVQTNKKEWLGTIGSNARFENGKVINSVAIWDKDEVATQMALDKDHTESDFAQKFRNSITMEKPRDGLSGGYGFKLLNESGQWNGERENS